MSACIDKNVDQSEKARRLKCRLKKSVEQIEKSIGKMFDHKVSQFFALKLFYAETCPLLLLSISSTFYEQLFRQYSFAKKL